MSKGPWKDRAVRHPRIAASAIPLHQADGLPAWLGVSDIIGAPAYDIPALFDITREQLERAIEDGIFPKPGRVLGYGQRGPLIWQSSAIKAYVEQCEAEQAANPRPVPEPKVSMPDGWSTTADLVKLLRVTRQMIHIYYTSGKIPRPQRFGGKPAWSPEQMHQILVAMGEEE